MSDDDISDDAEDVVGVLTAQIEKRFAMGIGQLKSEVSLAPAADPEATDLVKWHSLLVASQTALDQAEDALLATLETQPSEVDDPTMDLAHRVNTSVTARDGRALVVRWLLDPDAPGKKDPAAGQRARARRGPAVPTSAPAPGPAQVPAPPAGRGMTR
ncbi:hypothetical protein [Streptomyces sp. NPDC058653]|uniref:hypothetical protein n=1 Tax=Streptomyces sp. NPDC058653 TaxID=3346576 RepID=UPI003648F013